MQRDAVLPRGKDATWVEDLSAAGCDLLGLVVMQVAQQTGCRGRTGIGAEHARHVRPDLQALSADLGREVRTRSIRTTASQQNRVAIIVAGNETLSDDDRRHRLQPRLEV